MGSSSSLPNPAVSIDPKLLGRRLTYIMLVRVILFTLILGGTVAVNLAWGTPEELGGPYVTFLFVFIAVIYVLNIGYAVVLRIWPRLLFLAVIQLAGDLVTSAILVHATGGAESAFVLFFLLTPIAAAVLLDRRAAMFTAGVGAVVFVLIALLGFTQVLPAFPGQVRLPWAMTPGALGRSLLINGSAMVAVAVLAGYLAEQLRHAAEQVEVQQAHIDDLATLNIDIIRCLESGLVTISNQGRVLSINRAAGEILGLPHAQASGLLLAQLSPELAVLAEESEVRRTEIHVERTSRPQLLGVSVSPLTDHLNRLRGRIINFQDLTAVRQMEAVVQRSEHLASLGRMAAAIAHEIRNPLASISGSLELLRAEDELHPDNRKLMKIVLREIERLDSLITSFLEYARPQPPDLQRLELGHEIVAITEDISLPGKDAPKVTVAEVEPDVWVDADRDQLKAILWNLVRNASEAGESERVTVRILSDNGRAVLTVADTGAGIPADRLPHIFEPFFTSKEQGTGLGLAMAHRMVQEHGGTISVESEEGQGATFAITLPRVPPKAQQLVELRVHLLEVLCAAVVAGELAGPARAEADLPEEEQQPEAELADGHQPAHQLADPEQETGAALGQRDEPVAVLREDDHPACVDLPERDEAKRVLLGHRDYGDLAEAVDRHAALVLREQRQPEGGQDDAAEDLEHTDHGQMVTLRLTGSEEKETLTRAMGQPDRINLGLYWRDRRVGLASAAGRKPARREPAAPDLNLRFRPAGLAGVFEGFKRLLRPLVVLMYLAPALILAKLVFYAAGLRGGDWITVYFVGLVVLFFLLLAVLVFLYLLVGPRSKRKVAPQLLRPDLDQALGRPDLVKEPTGGEALARLLHGGETCALRLRGRARATEPADGPLLLDSWLAVDQQVGRLVASRVFLLELAGEAPTTTVVVDPGDDPVLVGARGDRSAGLELAEGLSEELDRWVTAESGEAISLARLLREGTSASVELGAEVEVFAATGVVVEKIDELAVAGRKLQLDRNAASGQASASASGPYRGEGRRGLLLAGTAEAPLIVRCV